MATISRTLTSTSGSAVASINITITYTVDSSSPSSTNVTSTSMAVGAISVTGGTSAQQAIARAALTGILPIASVSLTFGGQTVKSVSGITPSTTSAFSGSKSVSKAHTATTSPLVLNVYGNTTTVNISVPVRISYVVTFNANSGESAPANQIKWYDEDLSITTDKPTKTGYKCNGWATTTVIAGTGTVEYAPNQIYQANEGLNLYAVWEIAYQKPVIDNLHVDRCKLKDGVYVLDDDGGYAKVTFDWSVFRSNETRYYGAPSTDPKPYANNSVLQCGITVGTESATPTLTGGSGTASVVVGSGNFLADNEYDVSVSIVDTQTIESDRTTTITGLLSKATFPLDINADATAIGFFRPAPNAPEEGAFFAKNVDAPSFSVNGEQMLPPPPTVHAELVTESINKAYSGNVRVTAPDVSGYQFLCWAQVATDGWVGSVYPSAPMSQTSDMWNALAGASGQTGTGIIHCLALYIPI